MYGNSDQPIVLFQQEDEHQDYGLSLCSTATWRDFSLKNADDQFHHDRWAWTWSLTLKSKSAFKLHQLTLQWVGKKIDSIYASFYQKKDCDPVLIPIQENLVSEGAWDNKTQRFVFAMDEKIVATNKYYLVLSFPQKIEDQVRQGTFVVPTKESLVLSKLE
jgi:hypothetical protein